MTSKFDTCPPEEDLLFEIRYSLFQSFFFDLSGRFSGQRVG
jgi:hypothetical protein